MREQAPRVRLPAARDAFGGPAKAIGRHRAPVADLYHFILTRSWLQFLLLVAASFLCINALFACVFCLQAGAIANARSRSWEDAFYFSVQTMATIGYGGMYPATRFAHALVTLEAVIGMLMTALVTGVTFSRFARPTAQVLFAEKAVIGPRNGVPHLMFRMANWRHNTVVEAQLRVFLLRRERTLEGEELRRPVDLLLVRERTPLFVLTWTAMHKIDADSPFAGEGAIARLAEEGVQIFLSLTGTDETFAQTINARHSYKPEDIVAGARFHDVLTIHPDGQRQIDYRYFHQTVPLALSPGGDQAAPETEPREG